MKKRKEKKLKERQQHAWLEVLHRHTIQRKSKIHVNVDLSTTFILEINQASNKKKNEALRHKNRNSNQQRNYKTIRQCQFSKVEIECRICLKIIEEYSQHRYRYQTVM